ncbi:hypothetical protein FACS189435_2990 [Bacteroidia bacterium]|nr:hypothetical protein FACS189435_2990 [Bacteroidia bacterium]
MIPMIDGFKQRFPLGKDFIVVADSGLVNNTNIDLLRKAGCKYVIGARIKSESSRVKKWILEQSKEDNHCHEYKRSNAERLILGYSETRARKDACNRERGIAYSCSEENKLKIIKDI